MSQADIALDAEGNAWAVWYSLSMSEGWVVEASMRPAGGSWSPPEEISARSGEIDSLELEVDADGNAVALWLFQGESDEDRIVQVAQTRSDGTWGPAVDLTESTYVDTKPQLAIGQNGHVAATWAALDGEYLRIFVSFRQADGDWSEPEAISPQEEESLRPQIAVDGQGRVTAVWLTPGEEDSEALKARRFVGGSWGPVDELSPSGKDHHVATNARGDVLAVWSESVPVDNFRIKAAYRANGGAWEFSDYISDAAGKAFKPWAAVAPDGSAITAFERAESEEGYNRIRAVERPAGGGWGVEETLSDPSGREPRIEFDALGNATAVWTHQETFVGRVEAARKPQGDDWGQTQRLSPLGGDAWSDDLATDSAGNAISIWTNVHDNSYSLSASAFDATGPQLRSLSVPQTGVVGEPLSFSVSPLDAFSSLGATSWSFGDGAKGSGTSLTHAFAQPGTYTVAVTSADSLGNTATAMRSVKVTAKRPAGGGGAGAGAKARSGRVARVKRGRAVLKLRCPQKAAGRCQGAVRLKASVKRKRGRKLVVIASGRVSLAPGAKRDLRLRLNGVGKRLVRQAAAAKRPLRATLTGRAVKQRKVVLR